MQVIGAHKGGCQQHDCIGTNVLLGCTGIAVASPLSPVAAGDSIIVAVARARSPGRSLLGQQGNILHRRREPDHGGSGRVSSAPRTTSSARCRRCHQGNVSRLQRPKPITRAEFSGLTAVGTVIGHAPTREHDAPTSLQRSPRSQADELFFGPSSLRPNFATFTAGSGLCTGTPAGTTRDRRGRGDTRE